MRASQLTSRQAVLDAIAEHDRIGRAAFLEKYPFKGSRWYQLVFEGRYYDSKAIAGAALAHQYGTLENLRDGLHGGVTRAGVVPVLERLGFEVVDVREDNGSAASARRYWWVNQNQTFKEEVAGGFMWSPKRNANGARNQFYDNMRAVAPGDFVFSFYGTRVQHVGVATSPAETAPKPDFGVGGENWSTEGWLVGVEFTKLDAPFRPMEHMDIIGPLLPPKYSPLQASGAGLQSVYLAEISQDLADALIDLAGADYPDADPADPDANPEVIAQEEQELANLEGRTDIGDVERTQLVKARRGQGIFRTNVRMNESRCRITGITDKGHLRASHIKPWRDCADDEKIHGCNGLLLAPHVDHLFDRGWISFTDTGDLLVATGMNHRVLQAWGISDTLNVGPFSPKQAEFLAHHRANVFRDGSFVDARVLV